MGERKLFLDCNVLNTERWQASDTCCASVCARWSARGESSESCIARKSSVKREREAQQHRLDSFVAQLPNQRQQVV